MLYEKRIAEAKANVSAYIRDGLLRKTKDKVAQPIFVKNAQDSLKTAKLMLDNGIPLWTIVSSYYMRIAILIS